MVGQVMWVEGQKPSFVGKFSEAVKAVLFHYQRCAFGAQYGMGRA